MENFKCLLRNIRVVKNSELSKNLLQRLKDNKSYKLALKMVDKKQSQAISNLVEGWLTGIISGLEPMINKIESDPELQKQVIDATNGNDVKPDS